MKIKFLFLLTFCVTLTINCAFFSNSLNKNKTLLVFALINSLDKVAGNNFTKSNEVCPLDKGTATLIHQSRYPILFKTFLDRTNEKELSKKVIGDIISSLDSVLPSYFDNGINMFDVGFGNGDFSASVVNELVKVVPEGEEGINFGGVDLQKSFANSTNLLMKKIGIKNSKATVGNFRDDTISSNLHKSANLILASHFAYVFSNMSVFIEKIESIAKDNSLMIFLHSANTPIDLVRQKFSNILSHAVTEDTVQKIANALDKANLKYYSFKFYPTIKFPKIKIDDWKALNELDNDRISDNIKLQETRNLIEFFLKDPLEYFNLAQRKELLSAFRKLLKSHNNVIPLVNCVQIVIARNSTNELSYAVKQIINKTFNDEFISVV